ncbi:MAG: TetR/AcrR family transcriptional regulator [Leptospirales bacterium]|nr:TetR/AcrR family transcriptional regulator [Leptospirales bacterium]
MSPANKSRPNARAKILQAAEEAILRYGGLGLTLERTAELAGVSKGGLLYHFPDKDSLMLALIEGMIDRFDGVIEAEMKNGKSFVEAYLLASTKDRSAKAGRALIAVVAHNEELLQPLRKRYRVWQERLEAERDPTLATLIRYVIDGAWFSAILGLGQPGPQVTRKLNRKLLELVRGREQ